MPNKETETPKKASTSAVSSGGARQQRGEKTPSVRRRRGSRGGRGRSGKSNGPKLRIIPLGGLDAIGKNMTAFECGEDIIMVDAGLMFPDDEHVGVDLILPDYTYILENAHKLRGIIVTHGHEDHTGALPYLLKDLDRKVPILATKMTLGLIEGKLSEHRLSKQPELREVKRPGSAKLGCFELEFFTVNHSIPGAMGIFIKSPAGTVLHTGDFKIDTTPIDGEVMDFESIARFAHEGVDILLSDSTNANNPAFTKSEAEVGVALRQIIGQAKRKVVVAAFSSHIHRVQQVCDAAIQAKRKVAVTGRSMLTNTRIARELGYLNVPDDLIVDAFEVNDIPPHKLVVLCTGSQGEPLSALARMSVGEHRTVFIERGDTVIISATPVPGNEKSVTRVINQLSKIGADVYDKSRALVHVSGHAGQEELKLMLRMARPTYFMPVHGEATHLRSHARLGEATGVDPKNIFILENGDTLLMQDHKVRRFDPVESGIVYVDGGSVGDIGKDVLRDRQMMQSEGVVTVVCTYEGKSGKLTGDPVVMMRGIPGFDDDRFLADARSRIGKTFADAVKAHKGENNRIKKSVRDATGKFIWDRCHRRPVIMPVIVEI